MEHLIDEKNMLDVLGGYAEDLAKIKESAKNEKKSSKRSRVSFAQFSAIEGIQILDV